MPQYIVTKGQDAHVLWEKIFEADSVEHANELAAADKDGDGWVETGDTRYYDDMVILDDDTEEYKPEEEPVALTVTLAERDQILAALRLWNDVVNDGGEYINDMLVDIATNGDSHPMMDDNAIDLLCERLNG